MHRHPKLKICEINQIQLMIHVHVLSGKWPPKVHSVVLHFTPLWIWAIHLAYFIVFEGSIFEVFVAAFCRQSQSWTELFQKTCNARLFSSQNANLLLDFPLQLTQRRIIHFSPFLVSLEKSSSLSSSNSNNFCLTTGAFNFLPHLVTILSLAQFEVNISGHIMRRQNALAGSLRERDWSIFKWKFLTVHPSGRLQLSCRSGGFWSSFV